MPKYGKFGPKLPKNGIFQNFLIFVERSPDFVSKEPSTTPDIKFKSSYARKRGYAQIWNSATGSQKWSFQKKFIFLKSLQISLPMNSHPPPDIMFKSSYAKKRDFGLLYPNMEIQPQAPKNEIFQKIFIFPEKVFKFRL